MGKPNGPMSSRAFEVRQLIGRHQRGRMAHGLPNENSASICLRNGGITSLTVDGASLSCQRQAWVWKGWANGYVSGRKSWA
jgi:hypothetical protein